MEDNYQEQAARFIRNSSVNVQLEFTVGYEGETLFVLRATPWRNSARPNRMILVAEASIEAGLILLASALERQAWCPLDWRAKPVEIGVYEPYYPEPRGLQERVRILRDSQAQFRDNLNDPTGDPKNPA